MNFISLQRDISESGSKAQIQGRVRIKSNEIASRSADCVISIGAVDRCGRKAIGSDEDRRNSKVELIQEAYRSTTSHSTINLFPSNFSYNYCNKPNDHGILLDKNCCYFINYNNSSNK